MLDIDTIIKKHPKLAPFRNNPEFITKLFLQMNPPENVEDLEPNVNIKDFSLLVGSLLINKTVFVCRTCKATLTNVEEGDSLATCNKCGQQTTPEKAKFLLYEAADMTDSCKLMFNQYSQLVEDPYLLCGKQVTVSGKVLELQESKRFTKDPTQKQKQTISVRTYKVIDDLIQDIPLRRSEETLKIVSVATESEQKETQEDPTKKQKIKEALVSIKARNGDIKSLPKDAITYICSTKGVTFSDVEPYLETELVDGQTQYLIKKEYQKGI
jgi:hypothetical protein